MGLSDWFELKDSEEKINHPGSSRKLKLQGITRKNVSARWQNFRLQRLKNKLANKREKLAKMEFSEKQLGKEKTYVKVEKKTQAIANLEARINFIETGEYSSEEFINSRAIKLKKYMMMNLVYNKDTIYGVSEEAAKQITNEYSELNGYPVEDDINKTIDIETEKIAAEVNRIMEEKKKEEYVANTAANATAGNGSEPIKSTAATKEEIAETINKGFAQQDAGEVISPEEIANVVNDGFDKKTVQPDITKIDIQEAIGNEMKKINVTPQASREEIVAATQAAMNKIKVSNNESSVAKVNKFINDDGTYSLKREDIDEDFRINRFDRSQLSEDVRVLGNAIKEITPITEIPNKIATAAEAPTVKIRKPAPEEIEATNDDIITKPTARELPVVAPERNNVEKEPQTEQTVVPKEKTTSDLDTLMARVEILKAEQNKARQAADAAKQKRAATDKAYEDAMLKLSQFADSLEQDCNAATQAMVEDQNATAATEEKINAMIAAMEAGTNANNPEKGRGK